MKRITFFIPILILLLFAGSSTTAQAWGEQDGPQPARIRVIHAAPGAPPVNVMVNDTIIYGPMGYSHVTPYISQKPAVYNIKVVTADRHQTPIFNRDMELSSGQDQTIIATGAAQQDDFLLLEDNNTLPEDPNNARLRFVNVSPNVGLVNVVAIQDGVEQVWFSGVAYKEKRDYLELTGGTYNVEIRAVPSGEVLLKIPGQPVPANTVSSLMLIGLVEAQPMLSHLSGIDSRGYHHPPEGCSPCPPPAYCSPCQSPAYHYRPWGYPQPHYFPYQRPQYYPRLGPYPHFRPWVFQGAPNYW